MEDEKTSQPWTPGPWTFESAETKDGTRYQHIRSGPTAVADTWHTDSITVFGYGPMSGHIQARHGIGANARLIAAAPAMAEALALVVERYDSRTTDDACPREPRRDPPDVAACRAALEACGWQWGGR